MSTDQQKGQEETPPVNNVQYGSQYPPNVQPPPQYGVPVQQQYGMGAPTFHIVGGIPSQQPGQPCMHYNRLSSYEPCALACIIILCIEFFPLGLYSLFCLASITRQKCFNCGHVMSPNLTPVYVTFGILQVVFAGLVGLDVYLWTNVINQGDPYHH